MKKDLPKKKKVYIKKDLATKINGLKYKTRFKWFKVDNGNHFLSTEYNKLFATRQIIRLEQKEESLCIRGSSKISKKDNLAKHGSRSIHQWALWHFGSGEERIELSKTFEKQEKSIKVLLEEMREKFTKEEIFPLFSTAYFVAVNGLALLDREKLLKYLGFHKLVVPSLIEISVPKRLLRLYLLELSLIS